MTIKNLTKRRARVNAQLLTNSEVILGVWLEGEIQGEYFVAINPCRDDKSLGSFKVTRASGYWKDYAVDDFSGPDLVSLYMVLNELDEPTAVNALEETLRQSGPKTSQTSTKSVSKTVKPEVLSTPAPEGCHLPPDIHPELGVPALSWEYLTAEGQTAFLVYRFDTDKGKETRPVSYNPETQDWQWRLPGSPLPVYHLDLISRDKSAAVVVVEGEKAADAASKLFPDSISTTSASGSSNALKSDWSPLYGRATTLIPDADEPGTKYAMTVAAELLVNGSEVFIIDTLALGWTDGEDVADHADLTQEWMTEQRVPVRDWAGVMGMDDLITEAAARLPLFAYERSKDRLVDLLGGVSKRTLDSLVIKARKTLEQAGDDEPEHGGPFCSLEPWPEVVDGKALVTEIQSIIRSHIILSAQESMAVSLWIVLTYVFRAFRICPRLLVSSPEKRCGKTTLLETIQAMCFRGLAAANISAASLYRGLEAWSPTLLIDEADTFLQGNDELRGILNSGHTRSTAYVIRTVGDEHEPKMFPTFAPIAIGMIKRPPDTLLDRSIVVRMQRKLGADKVTPLPLEAENEYLHVRQKCLRWAEDNIADLKGDRDLTPDEISNDRARDNWIPLAAIALRCGLLEDAQAACRQLTIKEDDSLTVELLTDIQQLFRDSGKDKLPSKTLVKMLTEMEERPWSEYNRDKPLSQTKLAQLLKSFDVHTQQAKVGAKNLKHYVLADLRPLFERYLSKEIVPPPPESTAKPLLEAENPDIQWPATVADEVAVADVNVDSATTAASTIPSAVSVTGEVADDETLPLPGQMAEGHTNQAITDGSEVAAETEAVTHSYAQSANQGGRGHDGL
jgi:hypothetical protein